MKQPKAWLMGGILATVLSGGLYTAGLELWSSPEPCKPMRIKVGPNGAACPDDRHETRETWSDNWSTLHLECVCIDGD